MKSLPAQSPAPSRWLNAPAWILSLLWTLLIGSSLAWNLRSNNAAVRNLALVHARTELQKDILYRHWAAMHGGVYVPVSETTPPNLYVTNAAERDITTPSGRRLTLVDPAHLIRQVHELADLSRHVHGHITSLKPLRPENAADAWETNALRAFQRGETEVTSTDWVDSQPFLRVMVPLVTAQSCLKCHAAQGYREGDIRGGLGITLPLAPYQAIAQAQRREEILRHGGVWLAGLGGLAGGFVVVRRRVRDRDNALATLQAAQAERTRALEELQHSEARYRLLFDEATEGIALADSQTGALIDCNRAFLEIVGYEKSELIGRHQKSLHPPVDVEAGFSKSFAAHRGEQAGRALEVPFLTKTGQIKTVEIKARELTLNGRKVVHGFFRDVTERKKAEAALRESEEQYRLLFNGITDGVFVHEVRDDDLPGAFLAVNDATCRRLGYSREELMRMTVLDIDAPESTVDRGAVVRRLRRDESVLFEQTHVAKDGRRIAVEVHVQAFQLRGRPVVLSVSRDISERKAVEAALRKSEEHLRFVWESALDGMRLTDGVGVVQRVNGAYCRLTGKPRTEVEGRLLSEAYAEGERERILENYRKRFQNRSIPPLLERELILWNGEKLWAEVGSTFVKLPDQPELVLSVIRDISARKNLEAQLRQAQKMEAVGQLAGGVAHDFNNILTVILGSAGLLAEDTRLASDSRELVLQVTNAAGRAADLTRQLLAFSRQQVMQVQPLDLNEVLGKILKMLRRVLGEDITLQCNYAPELPLVDADAGMLEQVIMNLAVNARDAMPLGGRLAISTRVRRVGASHVRRNPEACEGTFVTMTVADTGHGMDRATVARIFEPFFTTKEVGKGTGLGLATVYGIVKQHHGWIEVTSEVNRGTSFTIYLPPGTNARADVEEAPAREEMVGGHETILAVEDDPPVRSLVTVCLRQLGYTVFEASSGPEALRLWEEHRDRVDLLVTDVLMPEGINGRELAERLRADKPSLRVIFSSGYSRDLLGSSAELQATDDYLPKPFTPHTLAQAIRRCLNRKSG